MTCKFKVSALSRCTSCGKIKRVFKCRKINLVIGKNTCRFCTKFEAKEGNGEVIETE